VRFIPLTETEIGANNAYSSGELNAKQRELQELQAMASRRLNRARVNFAEGVEAAKEAKRDIDYTTKKIS
jgi:biogenesis of lysosome-related organelles complex 1 subunit KXD1